MSPQSHSFSDVVSTYLPDLPRLVPHTRPVSATTRPMQPPMQQPHQQQYSGGFTPVQAMPPATMPAMHHVQPVYSTTQQPYVPVQIPRPLGDTSYFSHSHMDSHSHSRSHSGYPDPTGNHLYSIPVMSHSRKESPAPSLEESASSSEQEDEKKHTTETQETELEPFQVSENLSVVSERPTNTFSALEMHMIGVAVRGVPLLMIDTDSDSGAHALSLAREQQHSKKLWKRVSKHVRVRQVILQVRRDRTGVRVTELSQTLARFSFVHCELLHTGRQSPAFAAAQLFSSFGKEKLLRLQSPSQLFTLVYTGHSGRRMLHLFCDASEGRCRQFVGLLRRLRGDAQAAAPNPPEVLKTHTDQKLSDDFGRISGLEDPDARTNVRLVRKKGGIVGGFKQLPASLHMLRDGRLALNLMGTGESISRHVRNIRKITLNHKVPHCALHVTMRIEWTDQIDESSEWNLCFDDAHTRDTWAHGLELCSGKQAYLHVFV
ncbi:MAG: hypothetical protein MHM6MM_004493 [Cercozoa sp. M6MM]